MQCPQPSGLAINSFPGVFSTGRQSKDYINGIIQDAEKQGVKLNIISADIYPVPERTTQGTYLVALLSNQYGFHFMRRNELTGLWSHKSGPGVVKTYFYDLEMEKPVAINNDIFTKLASNPVLICQRQ